MIRIASSFHWIGFQWGVEECAKFHGSEHGQKVHYTLQKELCPYCYVCILVPLFLSVLHATCSPVPKSGVETALRLSVPRHCQWDFEYQ